jgi:hypothetical protein
MARRRNSPFWPCGTGRSASVHVLAPYPDRMKLTGSAAQLLATLLLTGSALVAGCSSDPTCDDLDSLQSRLDGMDPDDPDYNDVVNDVQRAEADCNA